MNINFIHLFTFQHPNIVCSRQNISHDAAVHMTPSVCQDSVSSDTQDALFSSSSSSLLEALDSADTVWFMIPVIPLIMMINNQQQHNQRRA